MNEFGYTPWGTDFLRLAEPIAISKPEPLLPRARSIARNGGVSTAFDGREARATIHRGSEASVVSVEFAPVTRAVSTGVSALDAAPGRLTEEHHATLVAAGTAPAPTIAGADCSCRARSQRCLHLLALLYDITRHVDQDPWLALSLQGYGTGDIGADADSEPPAWTLISDLDPRRFFEV